MKVWAKFLAIGASIIGLCAFIPRLVKWIKDTFNPSGIMGDVTDGILDGYEQFEEAVIEDNAFLKTVQNVIDPVAAMETLTKSKDKLLVSTTTLTNPIVALATSSSSKKAAKNIDKSIAHTKKSVTKSIKKAFTKKSKKKADKELRKLRKRLKLKW
jgi:hypothetical protein